MVKLLIGKKGSGKTKKMIELSNEALETKKGSIVFINKDDRLKHDVDISIRMVVMNDFEYVTNIDEYIGFIYGILSSDHDIEVIFIDGILKHADITILELPEFLKRLQRISDKHEVEFFVSISAALEELDASIRQYEILN